MGDKRLPELVSFLRDWIFRMRMRDGRDLEFKCGTCWNNWCLDYVEFFNVRLSCRPREETVDSGSFPRWSALEALIKARREFKHRNICFLLLFFSQVWQRSFVSNKDAHLQPWLVFLVTFFFGAALLWQNFFYSHSGRILCMMGIPDLFSSDFVTLWGAFLNSLGEDVDEWRREVRLFTAELWSLMDLAPPKRGVLKLGALSPTHVVDRGMQLKKHLKLEIPISRSTSTPIYLFQKDAVLSKERPRCLSSGGTTQWGSSLECVGCGGMIPIWNF